jgi:hypothetical protein
MAGQMVDLVAGCAPAMLVVARQGDPGQSPAAAAAS